MRYVLLSFDIEEFDLPKEYDVSIEDEEMFRVSYEGCKRILDVLKDYNINGTFFVSASFAKKYPSLIKDISKNNEIGLHCYEHKDNKESFEKLKKAKEIIERIANKKINGFRAPRFQIVDYDALTKLGIEYDSSLHPTYIPGKYNKFFNSRKINTKKRIKIIPVSVSPLFRLPLFWIAFRNLPLIYSKFVTKSCFINNNYVCLVFHPWDFVDISSFKIPFLIKRNTGRNLEEKLNKYVGWCLKKNFIFISMSDYLSKR